MQRKFEKTNKFLLSGDLGFTERQKVQQLRVSNYYQFCNSSPNSDRTNSNCCLLTVTESKIIQRQWTTSIGSGR